MTQTHTCPRCGYDLQGEIVRWDEACPLHGRCAECGTEFAWENIYFPLRYSLPWLVEHARSWRDFVARGWTTFFRVILPPRFWRDLKVTHPVSVLRAAGWLLLWCLTLHILASAASLALALALRGGPLSFKDFAGAFTYPASSADIDLISRFIGGNLYNTRLPHYPKLLATFSLAWMLMFMFLPWTRKRAKLRWAHIARAGVYSMSWVLLLPAFRLGRNTFMIFDVLHRARPGTAATPGLPRAWGSWNMGLLLLGGMYPYAAGAVILLWSLWWWRGACVMGWKLEHANVLWVLVSVAALLAAILLTLDPMVMMSWI